MTAWTAPLVAGLVLGAAAAWSTSRLARPFPAAWLPVIVLLETALALWSASLGEPLWTTTASIALSACLLTLAAVDVASLRLPNLLTIPLVLLGLAAAVRERTGLLGHLAGAVAGWVLIAALAHGFRRLRGQEGIGMGDAKLLAAAGAWCGWRALPFTVLLACVLAFAWLGLRLLRPGRVGLREPLPFGAPLALAFWMVRLYGPQL
jgi:leader peptidase (prepilin peptidase)/N-methyltransferase